MTKTFRVGDVVRFQDRVEYTIQTIGSGTVEGYAAVNGGRWVAMFECVLMRRSVHVGDVLRTPFGGMWTATTRDLSVSDYLQCTHADGTAIEPARVARVERPALARQLFETDDDVIAHVTRRAESDVSERYSGVMQRCWDRGFAGESPEWRWYVRAADRAKLMVGVK